MTEQTAHGNGQKQLLLSLNQSNDDFDTNLYAPFIIHGFEESWNGQLITEEECMLNMNSLIGQPVLAKYYNAGDKDKDHLGSHEVYLTKNRDTGEDMMATDTVAIGTFQSVEISDIEIDGETKRCLIGHAQIWVDRFYNICSLLNEWMEKDIPIYCSCEYVFKNYEFKDGVQYIKSPYRYTGHAILNSEEKDGFGIVFPAYDEARMLSWNVALQKDAENNTQINTSKECEGKKEVENKFLMALNEVSFGEIRNKLYEAMSKVMVASEYNYMWISQYNIFSDYFTYEMYDEEAQDWKIYRVAYSVDENDEVTVDYENRTQQEITVEIKYVPVEEQIQTAVNEAKAEMQTAIDELSTKLEETEHELNSVKEESVTAKETVVSLNETIVSLNSEIETLTECKEKLEQEAYEVALSEAKEMYKAKFAKLNAMNKFESEEVQTLVAETLDAEKCLNAKSALSDMLIELIDEVPVQTSMNTAKKQFVEPSSGIGKIGDVQKKIIKDTDIYNGIVTV